MTRYALFLLTLLSITFPLNLANANWAEDVWGERQTIEDGNPSITQNAEDGILITLPPKALDRAHAEGMSTEEAATKFLARYGPKHCSDVVDLTKPQAKMRVRLRLQTDASAPGLKGVGSETIELVIDHVPWKRTGCSDRSLVGF